MQLWRTYPEKPVTLPCAILLDRHDVAIAALLATLPPDEAAGRIAHSGKREEVQARRAALLHLAGLCGSESPRRNAVGQPVLPGAGLHLSLSSRGRWIALAAGLRPIGIDVETAIVDDAIPYAALHPLEKQWIDAIATRRPLAAARLWAAKEAYWKARAFPTSIDPTRFSITFKGHDFTISDPGQGPATGMILTQDDDDPAVALVML